MKDLSVRCVLGVATFGEDGSVESLHPFDREDPVSIAAELKHEREKGKSTVMLKDLDAVLQEASITRNEYRDLVREVSFVLVGSILDEVPKDLLIIQTIEALDDLEEASNLLAERLGEWQGVCYPGGKGDEAPSLAREDISALEVLQSRVASLELAKEGLDQYLESSMEAVAPNLSKLLGPPLGARLLALAGGLENLARMSASKVQVLGAEKALFKHIKNNAPPPKHGAIYQFPAVKGAPWWQRGRIARTLANHIVMAARADVFTGDFIADGLVERFEARLAKIKKAHPDEPKKMRIIRTPQPDTPGRRSGKKKKRRKKR